MAIDFILFFVLFFGILEVTLGKKFEGRGGTAIIGALALALTVGFALAEVRYGFDLSSLTGIPVAIFLLLFGIVCFFLMNKLSFQKSVAFACSFIFTYLLAHSISPEIALWVIEIFPIIDLLLLIAVVFVIIKAILIFGSDSGLGKSADKILSGVSGHLNDLPIAEETLSRKGLRDTQEILSYESGISTRMKGNLNKLKSQISSYKGTDEDKRSVAALIRELSRNEKDLQNNLHYINELNDRLENLDTIVIQKLEKKYGEVSEQAKIVIARDIQIEKKKFRLNQKLETLEKQIQSKIGALNLCIRYCTDFLLKGNVDEASKYVDRGIVYHEEAVKLFENMEQIVSFLEALTRKEYKSMKKAKKIDA